MIYVLGLLYGGLCFSLQKYEGKGISKQYLSKKNTQAVKGCFIIIVFLSHIRGYAQFTTLSDQFVISFLNYLGQLMVAMFLFCSGYGVYESIKKKGRNYIKLMPRNRIGKTFFDFSLAIMLFIIVDLLIGKSYPLKEVILAFTGWTTIGNSSWYMFAIFTLYILTFISFSMTKKNDFLSIIFMSIFSIAYIYIMSKVKDSWWSDTYICYVFGMWYSYYKEKIDGFLEKIDNKGYWFLLTLVVAVYAWIYPFKNVRIMAHNVVAIVFCIVIVVFLMKFSIDSKILNWCGERLFWLYILQRIPMLILHSFGLSTINPNIYLVLCAFITVVLTIVIERVSNYVKSIIWN